MNDEEIDEVEKFVRENSVFISAAKSSQTNVALFGKFYATKPHQFRFLQGERIFIKELVRHVRQILNDSGADKGLHHFIKTKTDRSGNNELSAKTQENNTNDTRTAYTLFIE